MTHLWFKARAFGWGWTPVSVEGWLVVLVFVAALLVSTLYFLHRIRTGSDIRSATSFFLLWIASLVGALIIVAWPEYPALNPFVQDAAGVNQILSLTSVKSAWQAEHWALLVYRG